MSSNVFGTGKIDQEVSPICSSNKEMTYASFFRYVKVAMNAAQLAMASWKPAPVARV